MEVSLEEGLDNALKEGVEVDLDIQDLAADEAQADLDGRDISSSEVATGDLVCIVG